MSANPSTVILINNEGMGHADQALQYTLIKKYLSLLDSQEPLPEALCFYASGVKLVTKGSPVIEFLKDLEAKGIRLIVCQTCLDFYSITDQLQVGTMAGMPDILDAQHNADKVITL